jgi:predicted membrane protein
VNVISNILFLIVVGTVAYLIDPVVLVVALVLMIPVFIFTKLSDKWQNYLKYVFWAFVIVGPFGIYFYDAEPLFFMVYVATALFLLWRYRYTLTSNHLSKIENDDDPSGNDNVNRKFHDYM